MTAVLEIKANSQYKLGFFGWWNGHHSRSELYPTLSLAARSLTSTRPDAARYCKELTISGSTLRSEKNCGELTVVGIVDALSQDVVGLKLFSKQASAKRFVDDFNTQKMRANEREAGAALMLLKQVKLMLEEDGWKTN